MATLRTEPPSADCDPSWQNSRWRSTLRRRLLGWFDTHARDLPWRRTSDPYRIWISEVMLQQTQVATVVPYYHRFLERFPTPAALAAAEESEVLRLWEGLGYYRRARQMHAAAQRIQTEHGGRFPEDEAAVRALPGVGRYTAGAILSIGRDQRLPVVEANTQRLYSRLVALRQSPASAAAMRRLWEVATAVLPRRGSGRFNQAAMELGSLICTPRDPACDRCPLGSLCPTRRLGLQESIPGAVKRLRYEARDEIAVLLRNDRGRWLLRRNPAGARWAGLWDFPRYDVTGEAAPWRTVEQRLEDDFQLTVRWGSSPWSLRYGVTRFRITLKVCEARIRNRESGIRNPESGIGSPESGVGNGEGGSIEWGWYTTGQLAALPLSTTGRKIADRLGA